MFIWKGCRKLENEPRVPGSFLAKTKSRKILRQDKSFEGTLYSHEHNSWETETKATVCVTRIYVSN